MQILKSPYEAFHTPPVHFGALLRWLRDRHGLSQTDVVKHLPSTISQRRYSSFELDQRAPRFDELSAIYLTLYCTGVQFTLQDRQLFLLLAKQKLENKITHKVALPEAEWDNLRLELAHIDQLPDDVSPVAQANSARSATLQRMETSHLVGREAWLTSIFESVSRRQSTKVIVVQGPPGSGKTSELHRMANHFLQSIPRYHVVLCELPPTDQDLLAPDIALELLLGDILESIGSPASMPTKSLHARIKHVLDCLTRW